MPESTVRQENKIHYSDAVFEGGGVRGIGHVGALTVAEQLGYRWVNVAGTSAGAIVAALVASGYSAADMTEIMKKIDYTRFVEASQFLPTQLFNLWFHGGLYSGNYIEELVRELLSAKGVHTFKDLIIPGKEGLLKDSRFRYKLVVIASDISTGRMLRLPQDAQRYGLDPDDVDVTRAARMSASIPFFFRPVQQQYNRQTCCIVDGALLSNFPVATFDVKQGEEPLRPTIGFRLVDELPGPGSEGVSIENRTGNALEMVQAIISTMLNAHDRLYLDDHTLVRTVLIPVHHISGTQFNLKPEEVEMLFQSGEEAARRFFSTWDFAAYKAMYRSGQPRGIRETLPSRQEQLHAQMKAALQHELTPAH